ncbi:MAG: hypothetical protein AB1589_36470 [Cyanobacteriota bacterium]
MRSLSWKIARPLPGEGNHKYYSGKSAIALLEHEQAIATLNRPLLRRDRTFGA